VAKLTLLAVLVGLASPAFAGVSGPPFKNPEKAYLRLHEAAQKHDKSPGRNIVEHGLPSGKEAPMSMVKASVKTLWKMLHPKPEPAYPSGPVNGHLASIMMCESGGNPTAVSPGGTYRGLYQFDYSTWQSVGGTGDPAAATPAEQHYRAGLLYAQRGSSPWPVCQYR
jgi:hypothetical protein